MTDYSSLNYWENRYTSEHQEIFEWYQTYDSLKEKIGDYFGKDDKILNVGCGTSKLAEDLYIEDIQNVTNIDFSENAIRIMEDRYKEQNVEMKYIKMNVMDMHEFPDGSFNIVFDKALLDCILCAENAYPLVEKMFSEIYRVLTSDGIYIIISNGNEDSRKMLFNEEMWEYSKFKIEKQAKFMIMDGEDPKNFHHIYILKKKTKKEEEKVEEEPKVEEEKKEVKGKEGKKRKVT